jgi:hypothetical protein
VDHIEYGSYVARVKTAPLAVKDRDGRPQLVVPSWPVMIQDGQAARWTVRCSWCPTPTGRRKAPT